MHPPSVFEYLDHHQFFTHWYEWKQRETPGFSHRAFKARTGLSLGYLTNILKGERVPEGESLDRLISGMELSPEADAFFRRLIRLKKAPDWHTRTEILAKIFADPAFEKAGALQTRRLEYMSRWYYVAIREMESMPDFREDSAWIQAQLRFPVPEEEIVSALEKLRRLRMLDDSTPTRLETPLEVEGAAVVQYHRGMIDLAKEAIDRIPHRERHMAATTLAVPASLLPRIKSEIQRFVVEIANLVDHHGAESGQADGDDRPGAADPHILIQVQTQMFPLGGRPQG